MFCPKETDFDYYFQKWVEKEYANSRSYYAKFLYCVNPDDEEENRKYYIYYYRYDNYMDRFRSTAAFYFHSFCGVVFKDEETFVHEFERVMMTKLCDWEEKQMNFFHFRNGKLKDHELSTSQIINWNNGDQKSGLSDEQARKMEHEIEERNKKERNEKQIRMKEERERQKRLKEQEERKKKGILGLFFTKK